MAFLDMELSTDGTWNVPTVKSPKHSTGLKGAIISGHGTPMFHALGSFMYTGAVCFCSRRIPENDMAMLI